jgi:hypothetical protein
MGEAKPGLAASTAAPSARPGGPAVEATRPPAPPAPDAPARVEEKKERDSRLGTNSPVFFVGAMVTVGAAYALGQIARGRLQSGFRERQIVVGGCLAVVAGAIVKLLGLAGLEHAAVLAVAGAIAVVAALLA